MGMLNSKDVICVDDPIPGEVKEQLDRSKKKFEIKNAQGTVKYKSSKELYEWLVHEHWEMGPH